MKRILFVRWLPLGLACLVSLVATAQVRVAVPAMRLSAGQVTAGSISYGVPGTPQPVTIGPDGNPVINSGAPATGGSPRLQKLRQLQFDRRPSQILKAWATPEKPKEKPQQPVEADKKSENKKPEEGEGEEKPASEPASAGQPAKDSKATESNAQAASEQEASAKEEKESANEAKEGSKDQKKSEAPSESQSDSTPAAATSTEPADAEPADEKKEATSDNAASDAEGDSKEGADKKDLGDKDETEVARLAAKKKAEQQAAEAKKKAEQQAEEAKKKAAEEKAKAEALEEELQAFQRNVTLGRWPDVKAYLKGLPEEEGKAGYLQLVSSLQENRAAMQDRARVQNMPMIAQYIETNFFTINDLLALIDASPTELDKDLYPRLATVVNQSLQNGNAIEDFVARLKQETAKDDGLVTKREAAKILVLGNHSIEAGEFLPAFEQIKEEKDKEGLDLFAKHLLALYAKDLRYSDMATAWEATLALLAFEDLEEAQRQEAMTRAISLVPKLKDDIGYDWLKGSFSADPKMGVDILAALGTRAAQGIVSSPMNPEQRLEGLKLQKAAVEAFLVATPDRAASLRPELTLFAGNWAREAQFTQQRAQAQSMGPQMQRDMYGNFYYMNDENMANAMRQGNVPQPIETREILEVQPNQAWFALIDDGMKPELEALLAQLYLKGAEEAKAFPFIESLAKTYPDRARDLVREFFQVWTTNHDPNSSRRRSNPYIYFFGFERRAESIPLTRSKQERNLEELAQWVQRLRAMPIGELDEEMLANAFTTCHSSAEVYRLEAIKEVFGSIDGLKAKTLSGLAEKMRQNLAGLWRQPAEQKQNQTKRSSQDIQLEVMRGYEVARAVIDDGLNKYPDSWELQLVKACIVHDQLNYEQDLQKSTNFAKKREQALAAFENAARTYAAQTEGMKESERSTRVFDHWFYAGLGASDLGGIDRDKVPNRKQPALIRAALEALPGEIAEWHRDKFANALFTRMGSVDPTVKYGYLQAGFEIVGDHKLAWEAKKVFDYYHDLVTEIKLETQIDGADVVGEEPFGVFVNLRHTREIERESGGFGRYLQNQNSMSYSYNYGRPTTDYRDKFQATVEQALGESFEVLSVTFQVDTVKSRAAEEYGWRVTPYAYLLLKARGPQVDKIAPLRLDLDFLDTSGYAVIPIESPALPVVASQAPADLRPIQNLEVVQTLDERQASDGKLVLEVKATGIGLVPGLEKLVSLAPEGFTIANTDDQGLSIARFDQDGTRGVVSERSWLITLRAKEQLAERPKEFHFGTSRIEGAAMTYQRYDDADLVAAAPILPLEKQYGDPSQSWLWIAVAACICVLVSGWFGVTWLRRPKAVAVDAYTVPGKLTPFTVMGLLQRIGERDGLTEAQRMELSKSLSQLEHHYFADDGEPVPDLRTLAETWVGRARKP